MLHEEVDKMLTYADELLTRAQDEADRSEEDVVTHLICTNARMSIANYMAGFLELRKVEVNKPVTLESLLDQCRTVDARFESVDLSPIYCRCESDHDHYCLEMDQVVECMKIAEHTRSIVRSNAPGF